MAESNQDNLPAPSLYFCHKCAVEITPQLPDHVCPRCQDGFIEPVNSASSSSSNSSDTTTDSPNSLVFDMENDDQSNNSSLDDMDTPMTSFNPLREMFFNPSQLTSFVNPGINSGGAGSSGSDTASGARRSRNARTLLINAPFRRNRMRGQDRNQTLAPMLQNLIVHISHGAGGDPLNMLGEELASNPGDYAWGRGGLDAVITHLLNQMEGNGAPPLNQGQIESIPVVKISQQQIDHKVSCSVCMEDFNLAEDARKLKCEHCFHESCITPWLKMHATCPVCRTTLNDENASPHHNTAASTANAATVNGAAASTARASGMHTPLLRTSTNGSGTTTIIMSTSRGGGDSSESTTTGPLVEDPVE